MRKKDIIILFKTQTISKKVIFYQCRKRLKCKGTGKLKLLKEEFEIIKECDNNIVHDIINFENKFNNLTLEELVKTLKNDSYELEVKTFDTKYIYSFLKISNI